MKKIMMILAVVIYILLLVGCGLTPDSSPPVDDISKKIKKEMGEDFLFRYRKVLDDGTIMYSYRTMNFDAEKIKDFCDICNEVLPEDERVTFCVNLYLSGGGAPMFYLQNYNDDEICDRLCYLQIDDQSYFNEATCDPTLYSQIEGIKELHVDKGIQDKADDMGIDWYSYWPDLEKVVVKERKKNGL